MTLSGTAGEKEILLPCKLAKEINKWSKGFIVKIPNTVVGRSANVIFNLLAGCKKGLGARFVKIPGVFFHALSDACEKIIHTSKGRVGGD